MRVWSKTANGTSRTWYDDRSDYGDPVRLIGGSDQRASRRIAQVIVRTNRMINTIAAHRRRAAFQRRELRHEPSMIQEPRAPAREQRQHLPVDRAPITLRVMIPDAVLRKALRHPLGPISITRAAQQTIKLDRGSHLCSNCVRIE